MAFAAFCGELRRFVAFCCELWRFVAVCSFLRRFAAFCGVLGDLRRFAANFGVLRRFAVNCGELRGLRRIAANCGVCGELWRVAANRPSQSRLSPDAVSVSDMTPSLHLIQQIEHLTIENGKLAQRLGNSVADKECKNGFLCSVQNDVVS